MSESDVDDDDNQEEEISVDSGDDQPSADVGSQDLCEVCMTVSQRLRKKAAAARCAARQTANHNVTILGSHMFNALYVF